MQLLIDANAVLRFILQDNDEMADKVEDILNSEKVTVRNEILAEVIYVLEKVYKYSRQQIHSAIVGFLDMPNVNPENKPVMDLAIKTYGETKLDFADTLLYAYHVIKGDRIITFDKKLRNRLIDPLP